MKKLNDTKHVSRKGVSFNAPEWGVDFFETFSPVIGFDVVRTVLAIATMRGWNLRTPDFKHAYLNAALPEEIWLERPDVSFVKELNAIYGLKRSELEWYKELRNAILNGGWKSSEYGECMYYCRTEDGRIDVLVTYVDDILLTGDYEEEVQEMVNHLLEIYEGRDLGVPDKLLDVALMVTEKGTKLDQAPSAKGKIIKGMGSFDVRKVSTPLEPGMDLLPRQENQQELDSSSFPFARNSGKLMFLARMSRPDTFCLSMDQQSRGNQNHRRQLQYQHRRQRQQWCMVYVIRFS